MVLVFGLGLRPGSLVLQDHGLLSSVLVRQSSVFGLTLGGDLGVSYINGYSPKGPELNYNTADFTLGIAGGYNFHDSFGIYTSYDHLGHDYYHQKLDVVGVGVIFNHRVTSKVSTF